LHGRSTDCRRRRRRRRMRRRKEGPMAVSSWEEGEGNASKEWCQRYWRR
jgi:hypothetical protein